MARLFCPAVGRAKTGSGHVYRDAGRNDVAQILPAAAWRWRHAAQFAVDLDFGVNYCRLVRFHGSIMLTVLRNCRLVSLVSRLVRHCCQDCQQA